MGPRDGDNFGRSAGEMRTFEDTDARFLLEAAVVGWLGAVPRTANLGVARSKGVFLDLRDVSLVWGRSAGDDLALWDLVTEEGTADPGTCTSFFEVVTVDEGGASD